jgi:indolepyruvate ferredoxin oxidoreductase alpha subunit
MERRFLSGNEAVAFGAWEAGVEVASGYPGTPSTEILETLAPMSGVYAEWSTNEKVALDVAIGAAYAGRRAMVTMKHVGLNVAADSLFYASMTGAEAGLLIVVADDPSLHSSQNEQDSRRYAKFARLPCLDPASSQEARDMVLAGFELSERFDTPVMLRLTTRVAHSGSIVDMGGERSATSHAPGGYPRNPAKYVMVPGNATKRRTAVEERMLQLGELAAALPLNRIELDDRSIGIVTCGVAYQYAREVFPHASFLKLGMSYPVSPKLVQRFAEQVRRLIVVEELDPTIEEEIKLMGIACEGKSIFPTCFEFSPTVVRHSAGKAGLPPAEAPLRAAQISKPPLPGRPPTLCPGCPHRPVFSVLRKLNLPVNGDIGCYTLGLLPPLNALHTCGCMGAGIGVAHGADKAMDPERHVAVIGDSTFFHSGLPALLDVSYNQGRTIIAIMDNRTTAMTGHQGNPSTGVTLQAHNSRQVELEPLVRALGISDVITVDPYRYRELESAFQNAVAHDGPSVVIARRECALLPEARRTYLPLRVDLTKCVACHTCLRTGCPALRMDLSEVYAKTGKAKSGIDPFLCTGCELCAQVCPTGAILSRGMLAAERQDGHK